ncbi:extracellular solute-binding protein [Paenibacillus hemerocallicola]|uniref:Extracellular solute-binding protein n=1 Tax=Paenibacillus hemerocallicola TaxID=1172614 RepID=A0A5C4TH70_9BACL|nr:extracellular solute-binding protein [Paenibacillus hemerocallicola]TNJ68006.1 extracellular solute-binding protein [Paenibacillus hemerocallicola]
MKGRTTNEQFYMQLTEMVQTLRNEIIEGKYPIGEYLPSEKALASRFALGNISVRKGLEFLVEDGLIEKIPRVGNRVKSNHSRRVTIKFACTSTMRRNTDLGRLLDDFHRLYPWITVETQEDTTPLRRGYEMDADVFILGELQFKELVENGLVHRLKPLPSHEDMQPFLTKHFMYQDRTYMHPVIFSPVVLLYNKAHFRELGLPVPDGSWTWDDLIRHGELLSEVEGRYGFCFHVPDQNRWPVFLLQSGESFEWDGPRLKTIKESGLLDSIKLLKRILLNRKLFPVYFSDGNQDIGKSFIDGKLSMIMNSYMGLNELKNSKVEYDIAPLPFIREPRSLVISLGVGISSTTSRQEESALFVEYLTSRQAQGLIQNYTTSIPSLRSMPEIDAAEDAVRRPGRYGLYREIMFSYCSHGDLNLPFEAFAKLFNEMKKYWAGMMGEDELCDQIALALSEG